MITTPPTTLDGATVVCWSPIDERHAFTGRTSHSVDGQPIGPMCALAVCRYPGEDCVYLFGCDANWTVVADTWHETIDEAVRQAELEYEGVAATWVWVGGG